MPLRIALVAPYDLARAGGVGNQIRAQARALRQLGHRAVVFGPASGPLPAGEVPVCGSVSVTVSGTESGLGVNPAGAARVAAMLRREEFDLVHVHEPLTPIMPWLVVGFAHLPVVGTFHVHREEGHPFYPFGRPFLAPLMRRLAYRIAVSDAARRTVAAYFPGDYDIIPNGIDVDRFGEPRPRPEPMVQGRRHVLYVGRLEPRKGVEHLIEAMAMVQQTQPGVHLMIVGDGPGRERLETLARARQIAATFVGRVDDSELPGYFQATDLVVSPALHGESFGIVLLEAMACGAPVVASDIDGYAALLGPTGAGTLVAPGDAGAIASAAGALLASADLRRAAGARGRETARRYDWPRLADRLVTVYEQVLHKESTVPQLI